MKPIGRETDRIGDGRVEGKRDFPETGGQRSHFLRETKAAGVEESDVSGEAFDFSQIVGRKKNRGIRGTVKERVAEFVAHHRIKAAERFVKND